MPEMQRGGAEAGGSEKPSDDQIWCYPPHIDPSWRLTDKATNNWLGTVETKAGEEVLDLSILAVEDFATAFNLAKLIVRNHNDGVGVRLKDYDLYEEA
jgi:hypothetical protein